MLPDIQIGELLTLKRPLRSVEFFPPKDDTGIDHLLNIARELKTIGLDFVSVTYGAGGSTHERSLMVSNRLRDELGFTVMPHLTCVGSNRAQLIDTVDAIHKQGFRNIMALRGDPPQGHATFEPSPDGLKHGSDLVALIRQKYADISIGVGGYPEKHPEAPSFVDDLYNLKFKVDQGTTFITTQLFFENNLYFEFVKKCRAMGITVPIIPGIMPVLSLQQIKRFVTLCGASLPERLVHQLELAGDNPQTVEAVGIEWALNQIRDLIGQGAPGFHLYVLNRSRAALALAKALAL
jgi:methylenetetrahydrofolate reductase (NADPH)